MDEPGITQPYYIAAGSSRADDRAHVLKYGKMFAVFNHQGDVEPLGLGEQGIFFQGTRFLSELVLSVWDSRPLLLSSTVKWDNLVFVADLSNVDMTEDQQVIIERGTLHIARSRFLWQGTSYEELKIFNYGLNTLDIPIGMTIGADFADIFEVRGTRRERRGRRLEDEIARNGVQMAYEGLDKVVRRTRIECDPAPTHISSSELQFEITLKPRATAAFHLAVVCDPSPQRRSIGHDRAIVAAESDITASYARVCKVSSSNDRFNRWVKRATADVEMMTVGNPETDYPYAGVPWFSTVFGRDGIITALQMIWVAPWIAKGVLQFLASKQATSVDSQAEAEPGKILHEMRRGEMAQLGEVPFGQYYGSVDATPLFVMLAATYLDYTGDVEFLSELWPHVDLALEWIDRYGDVDGDGFVEYSRRGSKGLVQQGWKDSNDSVFHANGSLAESPIALCEVQAYVYAAKRGAARICARLGNVQRSVKLEEEAEDIQTHFEEAFWCEELATYALALDGRKEPCRVRTSNPGHCLFAGIASPDKARLVAHTLVSHDFFTGWGIRTVGSAESRYNPLSYHNGSVWPHDNAIVASGMAKYGFRQLAGRILMGLLDVSSSTYLHRLPELFCGLDRRRGQGPTLYPVACSPQSWAAGAVFMLLQACLGISIDGHSKHLIFDSAYLPEGLPQLWIEDLCVGNGHANLFLERDTGTVRIKVLEKQGGLEVTVR